MEEENIDMSDNEKLSDYKICKKLVQLKQSAVSRNLEFDLSFRTVKRLLIQKKCFYTKKNFTSVGSTARTIDRVDSTKGYIEGNVVACTYDINLKKSNLTVEEIFMIHNGIKKKINKA